MSLTDVKNCSKCGKTLPITHFYIKEKRTGRRYAECKWCRRDKGEKWRTEKLKTDPRYNGKCYQRWRNKITDKTFDRRRNLVHKYGITLEEYNAMFEEQCGVCKLCGREETGITRWGTVKSLHVDHNHETGVVRGLLCTTCNLAIGLLGEDTDLILRVRDYLLSSIKV